MEREIRDNIMIGVVLMAIAVVIGLGFASLSIARGTANTGVVDSQTHIQNFVSLEMDAYNDKVLTGRDVLTFMKKNEDMCIFINTAKMQEKEVISITKPVYFQYMNNKCYLNYGTLLSVGNSKDLNVLAPDSPLTCVENSFVLKDGVITTEGVYMLDDNGLLIQNNDFNACNSAGAVEYIDMYSKFDANLIQDVSGVTIGVCFTQIVG